MPFSCIEPEKLYERDPKIKREDVEILQEWLKKQPHLPKIEESQLILFLHCTYYNIERTKGVIDSYFSIRSHNPHVFEYPGEDVVKISCHTGLCGIMPRKTSEGHIIFVVRWIDQRAEKFNFLQSCNLTSLVTCLDLHQNGFPEGIIGVFDLEGFSLGHLARMNLSVVKVALEYIQECIPVRVKSIHLVNAVSIVDKLLALLKPFMAKELFNLIKVHTSLNTLYKDVSPEYLPEDIGGKLPSCQILKGETEKRILENVDFFKWHETQFVDESKRVEKSKYANSNFGMEGTFKKLELD